MWSYFHFGNEVSSNEREGQVRSIRPGRRVLTHPSAGGKDRPGGAGQQLFRLRLFSLSNGAGGCGSHPEAQLLVDGWAVKHSTNGKC